MKNILVLCTGNSCRSIMAEALINHLGDGRYMAFSAGSNPTGKVHPIALDTLRANDIPVNQPESKSWNEFHDKSFDIVITVCDSAASEVCPLFSGEHHKIHWSTPDPASASGTPEEVEGAFKSSFLFLKSKIEQLISSSVNENDPIKE